MKRNEDVVAPSPEAVELLQTIEQIGIARFVSRLNSGAIPEEAGLEALDKFVEDAKRRPLLSRLTSVMLGSKDCYVR